VQLFWIEYNDGLRDRDDVFVLNEEEALAPQAAEALRGLHGADAEDEDAYPLGDIYPLHAAGPDGTVYTITLTPKASR
jgi:hypothetical protein